MKLSELKEKVKSKLTGVKQENQSFPKFIDGSVQVDQFLDNCPDLELTAVVTKSNFISRANRVGESGSELGNMLYYIESVEPITTIYSEDGQIIEINQITKEPNPYGETDEELKYANATDYISNTPGSTERNMARYLGIPTIDIKGSNTAEPSCEIYVGDSVVENEIQQNYINQVLDQVKAFNVKVDDSKKIRIFLKDANTNELLASLEEFVESKKTPKSL